MIKAARIIGALILLTGVIPGALAVFFYLRTSSFIENAEIADGVVTEIEHSGDTYHPVFSFRDAKGDEHEIHSSVGSNPPSHQKGEKVRVYYDPQNPTDACLDSFFSLWFGPVICGALAVVPTILGVLLILVAPIVIKAISKDVRQSREAQG